MFLSMERNLENGTEIHSSECGSSGIMIRLRVVNSENNEEYHKDDEDNINHVTRVLK